MTYVAPSDHGSENDNTNDYSEGDTDDGSSTESSRF